MALDAAERDSGTNISVSTSRLMGGGGGGGEINGDVYSLSILLTFSIRITFSFSFSSLTFYLDARHFWLTLLILLHPCISAYLFCTLFITVVVLGIPPHFTPTFRSTNNHSFLSVVCWFSVFSSGMKECYYLFILLLLVSFRHVKIYRKIQNNSVELFISAYCIDTGRNYCLH
jgi:hypothetical protein